MDPVDPATPADQHQQDRIQQDQTHHDQNGESGMRDVARLIQPTMEVVSISNPEPALGTLNVIGVYREENDARNAVLALESLEDEAGSVGLTVIGPRDGGAGARQTPQAAIESSEIRGLDPEGVAADIAPRTAKGALLGAVLGAVLVGAATAVVAGGSGAIAGALGGALFGGIIGAVWGAFVRMGGSDAYRETFTEPNPAELMLVSLHTGDGAQAERARQALGANADRPPTIVRSDGDGLHVI